MRGDNGGAECAEMVVMSWDDDGDRQSETDPASKLYV